MLIDGQIREEPPALPVACNSTLAIFTAGPRTAIGTGRIKPGSVADK
jgi:hypothetical protein